jgi:hypothetical protein
MEKLAESVVEMHRAGAFQPDLLGLLLPARGPERFHAVRLFFTGSRGHRCALPACRRGRGGRRDSGNCAGSLSRTSAVFHRTIQRFNRPVETISFHNQECNNLFCLHVYEY